MKQNKLSINNIKGEKETILKYIIVSGLFILAGFVVFKFYPSINKFPYSFEKGSPWKYNELTAPFAFEIRKSSEDIAKEEEALLRDFEPIFNYDEQVKPKSRALLREKFGQTDEITVQYYKYLDSQLSTIYNIGIVSSKVYETQLANNVTKIRLVRENVSKSYVFTNLMTTKTAYEKIINDAPSYLDRSILQSYNINNYLNENVIYDEEKTDCLRKELLRTVSLTKGQIQMGERIIDKGEIITDKQYDILNSYKQEIEENSHQKDTNMIALGQGIIIASSLLVFFLYFYLFRSKFLIRKRDSAFMLMMIAMFCVITSWAVQHTISTYVIPYALITIVVAAFFDTRTALFTYLTTVLICSFIVPDEFEFLFLQVIIGMISICTLKTIYQRSHLVRSVFIIVVSYIILYFGYALIHEREMEQINLHLLFYFLLNGVFLLFANPLIYIIEKIFGYTSDATLVELANTNNDIFRRFSEVAQASFNHSMQVSNLAEAAAKAINANPMLVRTGALYHDIGKMNNPTFFTENQNGVNPHVELNDEIKSAQIIIRHVMDGVEIARKYGLPEKIQEFIWTHHGKGKATYFYNTYKNRYPDKEVDESLFTYPGPAPFTKEQTILMMCDAVEAASRSLSEYTDKSINDLVEKIITNQMNEGLYNDSPISMKQINVIKSVLKEKLKSLYHTRIVYPELNKEKEA